MEDVVVLEDISRFSGRAATAVMAARKRMANFILKIWAVGWFDVLTVVWIVSGLSMLVEEKKRRESLYISALDANRRSIVSC